MSASRGQFVKFTFIKVAPSWRALPQDERDGGKREFVAACEDFASEHFLRAYSLVGTRGDTDLMLRSVASRVQPLHELHVLLNQTSLMRHADISHSYLAVTRPSEYAEQPTPLAPREGSDRQFLIVYPMVKRREWYRLPPEERGRIMRDHIEVGRKYGTIEINTSYSFGIDDQEFVVAFNADDPRDFLDLVHQLRASEASIYTDRETPIFTCISMSPARALAALDGQSLG